MKNDFLFLSRRSLLLRLKRASTETTTTPLLPPYIVSLKTEGDKKSSRTPKKSAKTDCTPLEAKLAPLLNEREMRARSSKRTFGERRARAHRSLLQVPHFMRAYACRASPFLGLLLPLDDVHEERRGEAFSVSRFPKGGSTNYSHRPRFFVLTITSGVRVCSRRKKSDLDLLLLFRVRDKPRDQKEVWMYVCVRIKSQQRIYVTWVF